jgi:nucleoside-diphosphate-sugar epimerase
LAQEGNKMNYEKLRGKKVLVTGGAGFVGSHLCEELLKLGAKVISLDDMSAGRDANIRIFQDHPNYRFVKGSVTDNNDEMREIFDGLDTVFHNAASKKNICLHDPKQDLQVNAGGTLNLLLLAKEFGTRKFVHASTGSVYGEPSIFPTTEAHPFNPVSYYGVSKLAGERYVDTFHTLYGMDTTILRYFHVFGPRQESNEFGGVVSIFMRKIAENKNPIVFGDGHQVRSFTWVKDLVQVNLESACRDAAAGQVYNAASSIRVSVIDLAKNMLRFTGADHLEVEFGDPLVGDIMNFDIDNSKVCEELGVQFNKDFWGSLESCLQDVDGFLSL